MSSIGLRLRVRALSDNYIRALREDVKEMAKKAEPGSDERANYNTIVHKMGNFLVKLGYELNEWNEE